MLGFFRRIRRKLLDEGSLQKYLIYAVGEIFLVMIGILLALQVNTWNERRSNNSLEREFVERLLVDVRADRASNAFINDVLGKSQQNAQKIVELWESDAFTTVNPEILTVTVLTAAEYQRPEHNTSTYDELIASGRIGLLQNTELRTVMMRYQENNNYENGFWDLVPKEIITSWSSKYIPPELDLLAEIECDNAELFTCGIDLGGWSPNRLIDTMSSNEEVLERFNTQIHYLHWSRVAIGLYDQEASELETLLVTELERW